MEIQSFNSGAGGGSGGGAAPTNVLVFSVSLAGISYTVPAGKYAIVTATISGTMGTANSNAIRINNAINTVNLQAGIPITFKLVSGQYIYQAATPVGYVIEEYDA